LLFAAAKTKAAEHWSGRFSEIVKSEYDGAALDEAYMPFDFFELFLLFFFVAITLLLSF